MSRIENSSIYVSSKRSHFRTYPGAAVAGGGDACQPLEMFDKIALVGKSHFISNFRAGFVGVAQKLQGILNP